MALDYPGTIMADSPVGYWRLGDGPTADDVTANNRDGTFAGSPAFVTGALTTAQQAANQITFDQDRAMEFDGGSTKTFYITMGDIAAFEFTSAFSVECWVKTTYTGAEQSVISKMASAGQGWRVTVLTTGKTRLLVGTSVPAFILTFDSLTSVNDGNWHHVVYTWDGTTNANGAKVYIDGALDNQATASAGTPATGADPFLIAAYSSSFSLPFIGSLDEPAVYSAVITSTRVSAHYAARLLPQTDVTVTINSVDRTTKTQIHADDLGSGITILDQLNEIPNTATLTVFGFTPSLGQTVEIKFGYERVLFKGLITKIDQVRLRVADRVTYDLECTDWNFLLDRRLVSKDYAATAAGSIASDIITNFTSGFTSTQVQSGLSSVDLPNKMERVSSSLTRLANLAGTVWYVDKDKDLHFRATETVADPVTLNTTNRLYARLVYSNDISQIRTRVYVEGQGTTVLSGVVAGATKIPVEAADMFSSSGGLAWAKQLISYTGKTYGVQIDAPASAPGSVEKVTAAGYDWTTGKTTKFWQTYVTAAGETTVSASSQVTMVNGVHPITVTAGTFTNPAILGIYIYRSAEDGSTADYVVAVAGNPYLFGSGEPLDLFNVAYRLLDSPPTTNTAGVTVPQATTSNGGNAVGSTTLAVTKLQNFTSGGGVALVTPVAGGGQPQYVTYTGRSGSSGAGNLTGVPASGTGAIIYTIANGDTIIDCRVLTGVPASGVGAISAALVTGDEINLIVQEDDTSAQTALAALEGGDGIHEHYIQDRRLSIDGATARADAELALGADSDVAVTYTTEDVYAISGRTQAISVGGISTSLKIQQVRISWVKGRVLPQRQVTATTRFKSFYQYVRDLERKSSTSTD